ncbi:hypothetical protein WBK31_04050 [Nonomuraea sp. N2-4H]|uniref:hypothetical protein n=1 Tax=Nonomuraea sp. N2-4H TaxID=3128898 RepID=UPI0032487242
MTELPSTRPSLICVNSSSCGNSQASQPESGENVRPEMSPWSVRSSSLMFPLSTSTTSSRPS